MLNFLSVFDIDLYSLNILYGQMIAPHLHFCEYADHSDHSMNSNELVWNARVTKSLCKSRLQINLDALDILGNLSNVRRTVNAQGRTETFYNTIPAYAMLHVAWKFSKKAVEK